MRKGLTLVEILVAIGVLSLLTGLVFLVYTRAKGKALQMACVSNLRKLYQALSLYAQDWDMALPPNPGNDLQVASALLPYAGDVDVLRCPAHPESRLPVDRIPGGPITGPDGSVIGYDPGGLLVPGIYCFNWEFVGQCVEYKNRVFKTDRPPTLTNPFPSLRRLKLEFPDARVLRGFALLAHCPAVSRKGLLRWKLDFGPHPGKKANALLPGGAVRLITEREFFEVVPVSELDF